MTDEHTPTEAKGGASPDPVVESASGSGGGIDSPLPTRALAAALARSGQEPRMPCVEDGSHSDDLAHEAEFRNRTGRHDGDGQD